MLLTKLSGIELTERSKQSSASPPQASEPLEAAVAAITEGVDAPPGACLAVSVAGEIGWAGRGVTQAFDDRGPVDAAPPLTIDTRTDAGSVTKVLATTSCLMALARDEETLLGRRLAELLSWTVSSPAAGATIAQLLEHRAGLWEWWPLYLSARGADAALRVAAGLPLRYRPGEHRHYSDLGFQLLGAAVAAVAGTDLAAAVDALVLAPLGLTATSFAAPAAGAPVAASCTGDRIERAMVKTGQPYPVQADASGFAWREQVLIGEVSDGNAFHAFGSIAGHAGLFTTARDLLRFGDELLRSAAGEGPFDAAVVERFLRPGRDHSQGLGFRRWETPGGPACGHSGFPGVAVAILPALQASVALVTNRLHVRGEPRVTENMWAIALRAAREHVAAR